ncbi:MAG: ion transporter [Rubritalea sp.]|jgi:voltage-gated potassium channel|tara:strand:+ start:31636 stop:32499 length:864 start_codon:yes stop_codon:yes gene_type:complete
MSEETKEPKHRAGQEQKPQGLKHKIWEIIFEAETPTGKAFDVVLLWAIFFSVLAVMLETVAPFKSQHGTLLTIVEWFFTIFFTVEYLTRLWVSRRPLKYATSFFGIIDLLSCLPTYLTLLFTGTHGFAVIRVLRLLRIFRVLKMVQHVKGAQIIATGLRNSKAKITVFFFAVFVFSVIAGTLMYFVEGNQPNTDFTSIPASIYYAIVSITTVGYGDITVSTNLGRFLTTLMILGGYAIIAVPTGIVSSAMMHAENRADVTSDACPGCGVNGHLADATFCRKCGEKMH